MKARRYVILAGACAALTLIGACGGDVEETVDEDLPVAAPAPELTAPVDTLGDSLEGDSLGAVP